MRRKTYCPRCREELTPHPDQEKSRFLLPSKCKNGHEFTVAVVGSYLTIGGYWK